MPGYIVHPIYTAVLAVILVTLVPRAWIRRLFIFGLTFGAVGDFVAISLLTVLLGVGGHKNFGPFGFGPIPFFPPLAWTIWFMMFFYFLPDGLVWKVIYVVTAAGHAVLFSHVLSNFNVFQWNAGPLLVPFLIYLTWFSLSTWGYERLTRGEPNNA